MPAEGPARMYTRLRFFKLILNKIGCSQLMLAFLFLLLGGIDIWHR